MPESMTPEHTCINIGWPCAYCIEKSQRRTYKWVISLKCASNTHSDGWITTANAYKKLRFRDVLFIKGLLILRGIGCVGLTGCVEIFAVTGDGFGDDSIHYYLISLILFFYNCTRIYSAACTHLLISWGCLYQFLKLRDQTFDEQLVVETANLILLFIFLNQFLCELWSENKCCEHVRFRDYWSDATAGKKFLWEIFWV